MSDNKQTMNEIRTHFEGMANAKDPAQKNKLFMNFMGYVNKLKKGGTSNGNNK
jgi:hypothetical protein